MNTSIKSAILILLFGFSLVTVKGADLCSQRTTKEECIGGNVALTQVIGGLCCWKQEDGLCEYISEERAIPFKLANQGYKCGIMAEDCDGQTDVGTEEYDKCINLFTQAPYQCCYVGDGRHNRCLLLNTRDKKIYRETQFYLRTEFADYDGDFKVVCAGGFFNKYFVLFIGLFTSLFFLIA